jgi:hypothetical protein
MENSRWILAGAAAGLAIVLSACNGGSDMTVGRIPPAEARAPDEAAVAPAPAPPPAAPADEAALPPGHPPIGPAQGAMPRDAVHAPFAAGAGGGMGMGDDAGENDGDPELPIRLTGLNSAEELRRGLAALPDPEARAHFERGFRAAFTTVHERRHYGIAETELRKTIELAPGSAEAYRALAYAVFNKGLNFTEAVPLYEKAVALKPDYGEAHYALAFLLGQSDPERGAEHFRRAMALGVKDERNLRARYYQKIEMH